MRDFAAEGVAIGCEPVRHGSDLGEIEITENELARFWFVFDRNFVAGFHVVGSNVHGATIHKDVAMRHQLTSGAAGVGETKAVNDIIESCFEELEKCFPGHAALAQRVLEDAPELPLSTLTEATVSTEKCFVDTFSLTRVMRFVRRHRRNLETESAAVWTRFDEKLRYRFDYETVRRGIRLSAARMV